MVISTFTLKPAQISYEGGWVEGDKQHRSGVFTQGVVRTTSDMMLNGICVCGRYISGVSFFAQREMFYVADHAR